MDDEGVGGAEREMSARDQSPARGFRRKKKEKLLTLIDTRATDARRAIEFRPTAAAAARHLAKER
jgi:hypothetical protein